MDGMKIRNNQGNPEKQCLQPDNKKLIYIIQ
jgi:hypothetical protein